MKRESVVNDLREVTGGSAWMSKRKVRTWLGVGDEKLNEFLNGLSSRVNGNRIEYFIGDIADRVMEGVNECEELQKAQ